MLPLGSTFQAALNHLTNDERGRVLTFMLKFYDDPAHPSISLERVQHSKSANLWSGRVSNELRAILQKDGAQWIALYVGHHDDAYAWAGKYVVGKHPVTGAWQIVAIPAALPETPVQAAAAGLFAKHADAYLLSLGVPELWLPTLRQVGNEDELLEVIAQLPPDAGELLLDLAAGKFVLPPAPESAMADTRNLVVVKSKDDLRFLLDAPLAKWIAFLHPTQQRLAQGSFKGAVKVTGSAGTGKVVVALHRAKHWAAQGRRVLLTSFVQTLCRNLEHNLRLFCTPAELQHITV
jgi:hypothetical protein